MNAFSKFHPSALLLYYITVFSLTVFTIHPVVIGTSLAGGFLFFICNNMINPKKIAGTFLYYLLFFILIALINPLNSHNGVTVLFFLNDNPMTYEAIIFGMAIALVIIAVIFWCKCYTEVMSSDKFLYLFGKLIPGLALLISMGLRFIPVFKAQMKKVNLTQKTLGLYTTDSYLDKLHNGIRVFGSVVTWSIENAIDTSDSMKARGYGIKGRTNFSMYRYHLPDLILLGTTIALLAILLAGRLTGGFVYYFYPKITDIVVNGQTFLYYTAGFILMMLPGFIEIKENIQWKLSRSKI